MLFMMDSTNTLLEEKLTNLEMIVMVIMKHKLLVKNISDQRSANYCQKKLCVIPASLPNAERKKVK